MSLNVFTNYIICCKNRGIDPTWNGLNDYKNSLNK